MSDWYWPVPVVGERRPVISDGADSWRTAADGSRFPHGGVDIMFRRASRDDLVDVFPPGSPNGSRGFYMPDKVYALAASRGAVWLSGWTPKGYAVVLDHGTRATFYAHLSKLFVDETRRARSGQLVEAGQPLGVVGYSPLDAKKLKHLHFEVWRGGSSNKLDPEPLMRAWGLIGVDEDGRPYVAQPPARPRLRAA
jgi:murein DD-endopeptidase MepM/ murein hydrolase activator NlpD